MLRTDGDGWSRVNNTPTGWMARPRVHEDPIVTVLFALFWMESE